jgi:hypothetical protein
MLIVTLRVFERMGETPGLNYDASGKIQNPSYVVKLKEFEYMNKWIPRFQMMGYVKVDFVDAYEVKEIPGKVGEVIPLPAEKYNEMKKALTDKLAGVEPPKPKSPLEVENTKLREEMEELRKQNRAIIDRLDAKPVKAEVGETPAEFEPVSLADNTEKVSEPVKTAKPKVSKPRVKK